MLKRHRVEYNLIRHWPAVPQKYLGGAVAKAVSDSEEGRVQAHHPSPVPPSRRGRNLGFLPGTLNEKVDPYLRPLYDALSDMLVLNG